MKKFIIILFIGLLATCTAPNETERVLEANGYTNIRIEGYSFFGCGEEDDFSTKFSATSPFGQPVTGVVCSGFLKGSTIRFD